MHAAKQFHRIHFRLFFVHSGFVILTTFFSDLSFLAQTAWTIWLYASVSKKNPTTCFMQTEPIVTHFNGNSLLISFARHCLCLFLWTSPFGLIFSSRNNNNIRIFSTNLLLLIWLLKIGHTLQLCWRWHKFIRTFCGMHKNRNEIAGKVLCNNW